jgi:uncharacterized membrane protein
VNEHQIRRLFLNLTVNEFDKQNDSLWKWGILYYNPNDPEIIVEKRSGLGWTVNFAHKTAYVLLFLTPAILLFSFLIIELLS